MSTIINKEVITGDSLNPAHKPRRQIDHNRGSIVVPVLVVLTHRVDSLRHQEHGLHVGEAKPSNDKEHMNTSIQRREKHDLAHVFGAEDRAHEADPKDAEDAAGFGEALRAFPYGLVHLTGDCLGGQKHVTAAMPKDSQNRAVNRLKSLV